MSKLSTFQGQWHGRPAGELRASCEVRIQTAPVLAFLISLLASGCAFSQAANQLTPVQQKIAQQKQRLTSDNVEQRRDALMQLGAIKHPEASRAAATGLNDPDPIVRVTAAHAITSLPGSEAVPLLVPQLKDKSEFVRREMASALGETRSRSAVQPLTEVLASDKEVSVRTAAAVALGEIGDEAAVPALARTISGVSPAKKSKKREDDFVVRSAAQSLGKIRSRAGVEVLLAALTDETNSPDVRRAAAEALGLIGDPSATTALQKSVSASDPYLSAAAKEALRRLRLAKN